MFKKIKEIIKKLLVVYKQGAIKDFTTQAQINKKVAEHLESISFSQEQIRDALKNMPAIQEPIKELTKEKINAIISQFSNAENLREHLDTRHNIQEHYAIISLLEDTKKNPQIQFLKDNGMKYLKKFKYVQTKQEKKTKKDFFYLLIIQDSGKTFISHFKTNDDKYLSKEISRAQKLIKGADIIDEFSQRTGISNKAIKSSTSNHNHTQKKQTSQALPAKHKRFSQMNEAEKELFLKERTQFVTDWNQIQSEFLNSSKETTNKSNESVINTLKSTQSSKPKIKTMFGKKRMETKNNV